MTDNEIKFVTEIYFGGGSCKPTQRSILDKESEIKRKRSLEFYWCRVNCPLRYYIEPVSQCAPHIAMKAAEKIIQENKYIFLEVFI